MSRAYLVFVLAVTTIYAAAWKNGWEMFPAKRGLIPQSARQAPGGYRSYHFWRGGK